MGKAIKYNWPSDTPSKCPPESAFPAKGKMYRFVKNNPPEKSDFVRWCDEPHNAGKEKNFSSGQKCFAYSVSLFKSIDGALKKFKFYKNRLDKEQYCAIAIGSVDAKLGVMMPKGADTHHELWLQIGAKAHKHFKKIVHENIK